MWVARWRARCAGLRKFFLHVGQLLSVLQGSGAEDDDVLYIVRHTE